MDEVIIQDLLVRGVIGISDRERANPQDILVNLVLYTDIRTAGKTDNVDDSVNYRTIAKKVFAFVEQAGRYTVEALATDIAELCLAEPNVDGVRVRVEKPGAVRFSRSVGVEIVRWNKEEQDRAHQAVVLLGSNIEPEKNIPAALRQLAQHSKLRAVSQLWQTHPVGGIGDDFINAAAWIETRQPLTELKQEIIQPIESSLGRVRTDNKNAPRTIDLDVILFDELVLEPRLWTTGFIAVPVAELRPYIADPQSGVMLKQVAKKLAAEIDARLRTDILSQV